MPNPRGSHGLRTRLKGLIRCSIARACTTGESGYSPDLDRVPRRLLANKFDIGRSIRPKPLPFQLGIASSIFLRTPRNASDHGEVPPNPRDPEFPQQVCPDLIPSLIEQTN